MARSDEWCEILCSVYSSGWRVQARVTELLAICESIAITIGVAECRGPSSSSLCKVDPKDISIEPREGKAGTQHGWLEAHIAHECVSVANCMPALPHVVNPPPVWDHVEVDGVGCTKGYKAPEVDPDLVEALANASAVDPAAPVTLNIHFSFKDKTRGSGKGKEICKKITYTGSRFPKMYCATARAWETTKTNGREMATGNSP